MSLSTRSIGLIVLTVAVVVAIIGVTRASVRVLGWMAAAATLAALIEPLVDLMTRYMRRGVAVLVTFLLVISVVGGIAYLTVSDVAHQVRVLQRSAPARAASLERSERFGATARAFHLEERTRSAVKEIPQRLQGGTPAEALRSAGTRGVAYLATTVLTLFLIVNGRRLVSAGVSQIHDPDRQKQVRHALLRGGTRGVRYTTGSLAMSAVCGLLVALVARLVHVPGAVPLGLWAALWDVVPMIGAVIGALPVVILASATSPTHGVLVLVGFVVYEILETVIVQRRIEQRSVHVGPFLTLVVGMAGLELYGLGGALLLLFATSVALATFEAWRMEDGD
ncbi:MAG: hypothetical protein QOF21_1508 [Actinomycetota bacterium]